MKASSLSSYKHFVFTDKFHDQICPSSNSTSTHRIYTNKKTKPTPNIRPFTQINQPDLNSRKKRSFIREKFKWDTFDSAEAKCERTTRPQSDTAFFVIWTRSLPRKPPFPVCIIRIINIYIFVVLCAIGASLKWWIIVRLRSFKMYMFGVRARRLSGNLFFGGVVANLLVVNGCVECLFCVVRILWLFEAFWRGFIGLGRSFECLDVEFVFVQIFAVCLNGCSFEYIDE